MTHRTYTQVLPESPCLHKTWGVRLAVAEEGDGYWRLKCGCIVKATAAICPECKGTGDGPRGCCGDICLACKGTGVASSPVAA